MMVIALVAVLGALPCLPLDVEDGAALIDEAPALVDNPAPPPPDPVPAPPDPIPAPPVAVGPKVPQEAARYKISYGILGEIGALDLSLSPGREGAPAATVRAVGVGRGAFLGLGETEKTVESDFDPSTLGARRWTSTRKSGGKVVTDVVVQPRPGALAMVRRRPGRPDLADALSRTDAVLDPMAFLLRVRLSPPLAAPASHEVLDGRGLWRISLQVAERAVADGRPTLKVRGRAEPIAWDGAPDAERTARGFTLWLADDEHRTPLRLVMPFGPGEVRAELVSVSRAQ